MKFLIDSMLPPAVVELLKANGHEAATPLMLGAHNVPDDTLVEIAGSDSRVIVTENASDFAAVTDCAVLLVRKAWWPSASLTSSLALALDRWAHANPEPGPWAHWLPEELR